MHWDQTTRMVTFLLEVVVISLSGVMSPGPLTAVIVGKGSESPHAGAWIAIGHGVVEVPLMIALVFGAGRLLNVPLVRESMSLAGAIVLVVMAIGLLRLARQGSMVAQRRMRSPFWAGMLLTIGNIHFLVWWATIGLALVLRAAALGVAAFVAMVTVHWCCDFLWSYFLSALAFRGGQFFGKKSQQVLFYVCGIILLFFAARLFYIGMYGFLS